MADCGCNDTNLVIPASTSNCTGNCTDCTECSDPECSEMVNSECIIYNGGDLDNLEITNNQGINEVFQAINSLALASQYSLKVTIPNADVLQLNSTPYTLVPAPGSGKFIQILSVFLRMAGTLDTAYTTSGNTTIQISSTNATAPSFSCSDTFLEQTNSNVISVMGSTQSADGIRINEAIKIKTDSADPTLGTGDLEVYIIYQIQDTTA